MMEIICFKNNARVYMRIINMLIKAACGFCLTKKEKNVNACTNVNKFRNAYINIKKEIFY